MSSSAESTLGMTFGSLQQEIARQMGVVDKLSDNLVEIQSIIDAGLRQVYWPLGVEGIPIGFKWAMLRILKTGEVVAPDTSTFALPDDFAGGLARLNITSADLPAIEVIERIQFETQKVGGATTNGDPKTATVFVSAAAGATESERYTVEWFPESTSSVTVSYYYDLIPDTIGDSTAFPFGAQLHSELILSSCLAVLEFRTNEANTTDFQEDFQRRLLADIARDIELGTQIGREFLHPITPPALTTLAADYTDLRSRLGDMLGFGFNTQTYSYNESQQIDRNVDRGIAQFYSPVLVPGETVPHKWSFTTPTTTIVTVVDDEDQDLPGNVGTIIGDMNYSAADLQVPVKRVTVAAILARRSGNVISSGRPIAFATRVKGSDGSVEQLMEILWWPKPDSAYTFFYQFSVRPDKIDASNPFILAGQQHAETIRESCFSIAEDINGSRPHYQQYLQLLHASVQRDKDEGMADYLGHGRSGHGDGFFRTDTVTVGGTQF